MIDTVVLDLGNVLVRWDPARPFVGRLPVPAATAFLTEFDFMAFNHLQDAGRSWADARADLASSAPEHLAALDVYVEHFVGLLEDVLVSGEVGVAKPDPRVFALLTDRFGLRPERTVFVDDSATNVAAGAAAGFDAVLFTTAEELRASLVARGVPLPRT